jgi:hypothetical protein
LCFIVVVLMIPKWVACSTSGMVILSFSLVFSHCLLFPLMWIATFFFGCNSYPSRFGKSLKQYVMHTVYSDVDSWTHLQTLHNNSIALRYGAIITVLKTSWTTRTLPEKDTKTNPVITDELFGPSHLYTNIFLNIGLDIVFHRCCSDDT